MKDKRRPLSESLPTTGSDTRLPFRNFRPKTKDTERVRALSDTKLDAGTAKSLRRLEAGLNELPLPYIAGLHEFEPTIPQRDRATSRQIKTILPRIEKLVSQIEHNWRTTPKAKSVAHSHLEFLIERLDAIDQPESARLLARLAQSEALAELSKIILAKRTTRGRQEDVATELPLPTVVIPDDPTEIETSPPDPRNALFDKLVRENPDKAPSSFVALVYDNVTDRTASAAPIATADQVVPPLPKKAPRGWPMWPKDKISDAETAPEFGVRVYGVWMKMGVLSRKNLGQIDSKLVTGILNWTNHNAQRQEPAKLPEGFQLLTKAQANTNWAARVRAGEAKLEGETDAIRLAAIEQRRAARKKAKSPVK